MLIVLIMLITFFVANATFFTKRTQHKYSFQCYKIHFQCCVFCLYLLLFYTVLNTMLYSINILKIGKNNKSTYFSRVFSFVIQGRSLHFRTEQKPPNKPYLFHSHPTSDFSNYPKYHCNIAQKIQNLIRKSLRKNTLHHTSNF